MSFFSVDDDSLSKTTVLFGNLMRTYDNIDWEDDPRFLFVSVNTGDFGCCKGVCCWAESDPAHWWFLSGDPKAATGPIPSLSMAPWLQAIHLSASSTYWYGRSSKEILCATDLQEENTKLDYASPRRLSGRNWADESRLIDGGVNSI